MGSYLEIERERLASWSAPKISGKVSQVIGLLIESIGPKTSLGELCLLCGKKRRILCQVVGFKEQKILLLPLENVGEISSGMEVYPLHRTQRVKVGPALMGRVIDALGRPIDGKGPLQTTCSLPLFSPPPNFLERARIKKIFETGVKSIDALCTLGEGQKIGIFSPSGVGKSTLVGMLARQGGADVNVIALIGERGREVGEFLEKELGPKDLNRSVVVVATSDQAALMRSQGALVATTIAEYFRDQGKSVLLLMDSLSRYAMALREVGLAIGEPPTARGYPPSLFALLPQLLERVGCSSKGSITAIYTVLTEAEEFMDPLAEQVRSLLDGHLTLSLKMAQAGKFPAIDPLRSLSRVMRDVVSSQHYKASLKIRDCLETYREIEDLVHVGAYQRGAHPKIDWSLSKIDKISAFLQQDLHEKHPYQKCEEQLIDLMRDDAAL